MHWKRSVATGRFSVVLSRTDESGGDTGHRQRTGHLLPKYASICSIHSIQGVKQAEVWVSASANAGESSPSMVAAWKWKALLIWSNDYIVIASKVGGTSNSYFRGVQTNFPSQNQKSSPDPQVSYKKIRLGESSCNARTAHSLFIAYAITLHRVSRSSP